MNPKSKKKKTKYKVSRKKAVKKTAKKKIEYPKIVVTYEGDDSKDLIGFACEVYIDGKFLVFCSNFTFTAGPQGAFLTIDLLDGAIQLGKKRKDSFHPTSAMFDKWNCHSWEKTAKLGEKLGRISLTWKDIPFELVKKKKK